MGRRGLLWTLFLAGCGRALSDNSHSAAVERIGISLRPLVVVANSPPVTYRLTDRMTHYHTPGISIAVVDSGRLIWARGFGVKESGTADSVTDTTMFQAASISKPVSATAMLRLVEEGKLNLDQDVNTYLTSWKVPDGPFTSQHKVTLRRLASHAAGLTVHGFPGYKPTDSIPSVPQILDGAKPANTAPVRVDTVPGSRWLFAIAAEYGWPDYGPRHITPLAVDSSAMDRVVGTYSVRQEGFGEVSLVVVREGTKLFGEAKPFVERSELVFLEANKVIGVANGMEMTLEPAPDGRIGAVELGGTRLTRKEK
ncbi:MAG: serine hydrolase domain-containing protein [Gemmatimonadales bacterium]